MMRTSKNKIPSGKCKGGPFLVIDEPWTGVDGPAIYSGADMPDITLEDVARSKGKKRDLRVIMGSED